MKIIEPNFEILTPIEGPDILKLLEYIGRTAYKSEDLITEESYKRFINLIMSKHHESVIEHIIISVKFTVDRGISHELVRHRIGASYCQESTRYCNYSKGKFGNELTFIKPFFFKEDSEAYHIWKTAMADIEKWYLQMISLGVQPQEARSILPNSLKTEIVVTMNLRAWRHFFELRCDTTAHPQMIEITKPLLNEFNKHLPEIFGDLHTKFFGK